MTTVAWRRIDGVIASDRQCGGWMNTGKLFHLADGSVLSGAGYLDDIVEVAAWIGAGCKPEDKPALGDDKDDSSGFILACPDGKAYWLTTPWLRRVEILEPFYAVGSGAQYALGAMAAGANAKRAVEIACRYDEHTGKGVNAIKVRK